VKKVVIIGAGGHGLETADLLAHCGLGDRAIEGFLDDDERLRGSVVHGHPVVGGVAWLEQADPAAFDIFIGIGIPEQHKRIAEHAMSLGFSLPSLISPLAFVSAHAKIGIGVKIMPFSAVGPAAVINDHCLLYYHSSVAHGTTVGKYSVLCSGVQIAGSVNVKEGCWVGIGASVIQGVTLGKWSYIGAGAAVIGDIRDHTTCVGVPAKVIREKESSY